MKYLFKILLLLIVVQLKAQIKPVDMVYPQLDAAHSRWFFFSSACKPFGMVSVFPDNNVSGEWESGYRYDEDTIRCISHIHEWQLAGVAVMPVAFDDESEIKKLFNNYASSFSHQSEIIKPGFHQVNLIRYGIDIKLTATDRAAYHWYNYHQKKYHGIIIDVGCHLGPSDMLRGGFKIVNDSTVEGFTVNGPTMRRPKEYPVFFNIHFNQSIQKVYFFHNNTVAENITQWNGESGKILIVFKENVNALMSKVGVSFTSEKGAALNREREIGNKTFDQIKSEAVNRWNEMLSRIKIKGGTKQQQQRFYTDLWHSIQGRRMMNDIDGKYADCTGSERVIKQLPLNKTGLPKFNMYNSDAFWGAQWALNILWQLVYPEVAEEFCNSFLEYYKNGGLIPRGPSGGNYTFVMTGASSTPFFVSAYQKGIRGFDIALAYEGLKKNHMPGGMMSIAGYEHKTAKGGGLEFYIQHGYVPYPLSDTVYGMHQDGAAITLENAYQDWTLAQLALALNKKEDANYFLNRSSNFKNIYNKQLRFFVPKDKAGNWKGDFDPLLFDNGFEEANAAQYLWFVPHNLPALFQLMGGTDSAVERLNKQFQLSQPYRFCHEHPEMDDAGKLENENYAKDAQAPKRKFVNDKRLWISYSNQPSTQTAFIFNYAKAPWLTQYWSRMVVDSAYSALDPHYGYNGDEDQGLMGTLSVLMKIGLFQMTGGCEANPKYEIGSPLFDKIIIQLQPKYFKANKLEIIAEGNSSKNIYIQSATINNKPLNKFYFNQSDINKGMILKLKMGDTPNKKWGID